MGEGKSGGGVLTVAKVRTAKPGKYHDKNGSGLLLRVDLSGGRFWIQRMVIYGKRHELGLGSFPTISLAAARAAALENKRLVYAGGDPLAERRKARETLTFEQAVDCYLAAKLNEFRNEKHKKQWRSTLDSYAKPVLGALPVQAITTADVLRVLQPIWADKTETASRLRGRLENVLSWATVAGHRSGDNPARWKGNLSELLPKPNKVAKGKHWPAVALKDAARWWAQLAEREGMAARALQFAALTGARSGEVRGMTWAELDRTSSNAGATWAIPGERMKASRDHKVPLSGAALAILDALPRLEGSEFVFFAPRGGALSDMSLSAVMRRMQEAEVKAGREGFLDPLSKRPAVPHGLRSTFRQWAAERGFARDMAELALAHNVGSEVERAYQRSDMLERRRDMMAAWASFLAGEEASASNVVRLGNV